MAKDKGKPKAPRVTTFSSAPPGRRASDGEGDSSTAVRAATSCSPAAAKSAGLQHGRQPRRRLLNVGAHDQYVGAPAPTPWFCSSPTARRSSPRLQQDIAAFQDFLGAATTAGISSRASTSTCATSRHCRCSSSTQRRPRTPTPARRTRTPRSWWPALGVLANDDDPDHLDVLLSWIAGSTTSAKGRPSCSPPTAATPTTRAARWSCRS